MRSFNESDCLFGIFSDDFRPNWVGLIRFKFELCMKLDPFNDSWLR